MTKLGFKSLAVAFVKSGQLTGTGFLLLTFMGMLFHGKFVWVEPNIAILTFEIILSSFWFVGSFIDTIQTVIHKEKDKKKE